MIWRPWDNYFQSCACLEPSHVPYQWYSHRTFAAFNMWMVSYSAEHEVAAFPLSMYGTSSLARTLMSQSRCFCFPLKTYTHGTTSPFSAADHRLLLSTWQVISLPLFWRKIFPAVCDQQWCRLSSQRLQMDRDHCHFHRGGLIFEGKCIFENKPLPSIQYQLHGSLCMYWPSDYLNNAHRDSKHCKDTASLYKHGWEP